MEWHLRLVSKNHNHQKLKIMNVKILGTAAAALLIAVSCGSKKTENEEVVVTEMAVPASITIEKFVNSPAYASSTLPRGGLQGNSFALRCVQCAART
jgi:hypothetical protein